jgi:hypothetical protein
MHGEHGPPCGRNTDKIAEITGRHFVLHPSACQTDTIDDEPHSFLTILKAKTGHDFSCCKRNTVLRRIKRRKTYCGQIAILAESGIILQKIQKVNEFGKGIILMIKNSVTPAVRSPCEPTNRY